MATGNSADLFNFANQLALISSEVLRYRIMNEEKLTDEQQNLLESIETKLDQATAKIRARGVHALGAETETDRLEIVNATKVAEAKLQQIKKFEHALDIATSVLNLALVVMTRQPGAILDALKDVKDKTSMAGA